VVALVVLGPERLPTVARTAGALLGRAQRYINDVKSDIQRQVDLEEFNRIKSTFYDAAKDIESSVRETGREIEAAGATLNESVAGTRTQPAPTAGKIANDVEPPPDVAAFMQAQGAPTAARPAHDVAPPPELAAPAQLDLWLEPVPVAQAAEAMKV
jgi:sec-independent protein translocase protein TatB